VDRVNELFVLTFADVAQVRIQNPIVLSDDTEPQPDLSLLRRRPDYHASAHPGPDDVFLVVEIADTSAAYDRRVKAPLYARRGIPEYWLIDLNREIVTVYRDPGPEGYGARRVAQRGETLAPTAFPDRELTVDALLG
jgi:Uma2 family endonuclease